MIDSCVVFSAWGFRSLVFRTKQSDHPFIWFEYSAEPTTLFRGTKYRKLVPQDLQMTILWIQSCFFFLDWLLTKAKELNLFHYLAHSEWMADGCIPTLRVVGHKWMILNEIQIWLSNFFFQAAIHYTPPHKDNEK